MFLQEKINKVIDTVFSNLDPKKNYSFKEICDYFNKAFNNASEEFPVKIFSFKTNFNFVQNGPFGHSVSGYYSPAKTVNSVLHGGEFVCIEINEYGGYNSKYSFTKSLKKSLKFEISRVMQHEFIHYFQGLYQSKNCVINFYSGTMANHISYLNDPHELDARAHCATLEISRYGKILKPTLEYMWSCSPTFQEYNRNFQTMNKKVMKKLIKKIYQNLEKPECHWKE